MIRFRASSNPIGAIGYYLSEVVNEAKKRNYVFDASKIESIDTTVRIPVTDGQVLYEKEHLSRKLTIRDPQRIPFLEKPPTLIYPLFIVITGGVEDWEIV